LALFPLASAKPVTDEKPRPIMEYWWLPDGTRIVYAQDRGGNENWVLYGVDVATGTQITYTDTEKVTVRVIGASPKVPGSILIGLNNRVPQFHDVYRLDLATGKPTLVGLTFTTARLPAASISSGRRTSSR